MATKDETARQIAELIAVLDGHPDEYSFYIPGWPPESCEMGLRWMEATLWEGFYVSYLQDSVAKTVRFKVWEYGQEEPAW